MVSNEEDTKTKILKVLKEAAPQDLSIQEIADGAGVSRETASKYVMILEAEGRVVKTRQIGKAKMYMAL